jgi:hypothetical protein
MTTVIGAREPRQSIALATGVGMSLAFPEGVASVAPVPPALIWFASGIEPGLPPKAYPMSADED